MDIGSGLNICSTSFFTKLDKDKLSPITKSSLKIEGFNNMKKQCMGMIELLIQLNPKVIHTTYYVIVGGLPYNLLLRKLWIQAMGVVPSTLHRCIKFEH